MANTHNLFQKFHDDIQILNSKKDKLKLSKEANRNRIRKFFKNHDSKLTPKFYIQGSYKMGSAVRTKDDTCDLDDGVYFENVPDEITCTQLQKWVLEAVTGYTDTKPQHRKKCITVIYLKDGIEDYNIDLPVYKIDGNDKLLAIKDAEWESSDPKEFNNWFKSKKKTYPQLIRFVRYLKIWCDWKRNKMPSGLAMSILASNAIENIVIDTKRDDKALRDILKDIQKTLKLKFTCVVPAEPFDDLFANYDDTRKNNFLDNLQKIIDDADAAIQEKNEKTSSQFWKKHLGDRFPEGEDKDDYSGIIGTASTSKPWQE